VADGTRTNATAKVVAQIMADRPVTVRRGKISDRIGRLPRADVIRLNRALAFCMGLSD